MTDLEITKLCAEAMDFEDVHIAHGCMGTAYVKSGGRGSVTGGFEFRPLHDDAQAMALGKAHPEIFEEAIILWRRGGMKDSLNLILCQMIASTR